MILELTEKEAQQVITALANEGSSWSEVEGDGNDQRNKIDRCVTILGKINKAQQPQEDALITSKDLFNIISLSKQEYRFLNARTTISNQSVEEKDFKHICLVNAVLLWLNSKYLLKKLVRFDITDTSSEFEETE